MTVTPITLQRSFLGKKTRHAFSNRPIIRQKCQFHLTHNYLFSVFYDEPERIRGASKSRIKLARATLPCSICHSFRGSFWGSQRRFFALGSGNRSLAALSFFGLCANTHYSWSIDLEC